MDKQVEESYDKLDDMNVIYENEEEIKELWKEKCEISNSWKCKENERGKKRKKRETTIPYNIS